MENDLEYIYDGTFEGFLCCIYASYVRREIPRCIYVEDGVHFNQTGYDLCTEFYKEALKEELAMF